MSENIEIKTSLTAHDAASPVIKGLLANVRNLERTVKSFNASVGNLGRSGAASMATFSRATDAVTARMSGFVASNRSASQSIARDFKRANDQRLSDARRMYGQLEGLERGYQRQIERRVAAERRAERHAGSRSGGVGGSRLSAPRIRTIAIGAAIAGGGVAGAFRERMKVEAAEVRAQMFGELSKSETTALRKSYADKAGIKYGVGVTKALDAATEGLKAGISKEVVGEFGDLALQAQAGLDISLGDTANLMGKLASQIKWNKDRYANILNAVAIANRDTASSGEDIVQGMRRGMSALAVTRMTPEQLSGLIATEVGAGIQAGKSGTFSSFFVSQIAGADSAHGQQAKDLSGAARYLGYGSRAGMAKAMRERPMEAIQQIVDNLAKMPEALRVKVAKQIGGRQWSDELLTLVLARDKLREVEKNIATEHGYINKVSLLRIRSLQGRWASISAAGGLFLSKFGAGFDSMFTEISDAIIRHSETFNWDSIQDHVAGFVNGLKSGFGLKNWGELIDKVSDWFKPGSIKAWKEFGKGLAEGIGEFATGLKVAFTALSFLTSGNSDPKSIGKTIARVGGVVVALSLLTPVVGTLFAFGGALRLLAASPIGRIVIGLGALAIGLHRVLSYVSDRIFSVFVSIVDGVKSVALSIINTVRGWIGLAPIGNAGGGASGSWTQRSGSPGASGSWSPVTDRVKASFTPTNFGSTSSGGGGAINSTEYDKMFAGTALAGRQSEIEAAARANGIPAPLLASIMAHETGRGKNVRANNPGGLMNPDTGYRTKQGFASLSDGINATARTVSKNWNRAGGNLARMGQIYAPTGSANDPHGLNGNWTPAVSGYISKLSSGSTSTGILGQSPADIAKQYVGLNEYRDRSQLTQLLHHDVAGRANAWCARFVNEMQKKAGIAGTGTALANDYQKWGKGIPLSEVKSGDVLVQPNGRGPGQAGGHVGMATGNTRTVGGQLQVEMISGNDSDSVKTSWRSADRLMARRAIGNVPSPAEVIANVPQSNGAATRALLERNGSALLGGGGGPVAININGNSHDPEALAALVQRRIEESRNWVTHENASDNYV